MTSSRIILAAVACVTLAAPASAQHAPLKAALTAYAATAAIDTAQTARCLHEGRCREGNPVQKPLATPAGIVVVKAAATSGLIWTVWRLRTQHPKLALACAGTLVAIQSAVVVSNYRQLRGTR